MSRMDVTEMSFAKLYPLLVAKAERKGRSREEVDQPAIRRRNLPGWSSPMRVMATSSGSPRHEPQLNTNYR